MTIKLTSMAACAGCAAKLDPRALADVVRNVSGGFAPIDYPALLVGLDQPDDAAVYQIDADRAIVSTVDFFPPIVDDPYDFGVIAATNAISDIYAMGGDPLFAINLVAYPADLGTEHLEAILRGGADAARSAGAVVAGGHTIADDEPKYGMAVTGIVRTDAIFTKGGARPGDVLVLTKPLGTGTITTALKQGKADSDHVAAAVRWMKTLNRDAMRAARGYAVHAMTDVTGFSLAGHAHEMAHLSEADFVLDYDRLPWLDGARDYAQAGIFPGGQKRNRDYFGQWVSFEGPLEPWETELVFDPQTSGGLLIALRPDDASSFVGRAGARGGFAAQIGTVAAGSGRLLVRR